MLKFTNVINHQTSFKYTPLIKKWVIDCENLNCHNYYEYKDNEICFILRLSNIERIRNKQFEKFKDIQIIDLNINTKRQGIGTTFLLDLINIALSLGKGVKLQATISDESIAWAKRLQTFKILYTDNDYDWYSTSKPDNIHC